MGRSDCGLRLGLLIPPCAHALASLKTLHFGGLHKETCAWFQILCRVVTHMFTCVSTMFGLLMKNGFACVWCLCMREREIEIEEVFNYRRGERLNMNKFKLAPNKK
jgi:hypothetical protein